jgi:5-methylcytosine-specific restriction enzyme subunit McrC
MKVIRVFEYSQLSINGIDFTQAHFEQLVRYNEQHGNKYFSVGHKRIYFKNYVGVFQVGNLVIEILPKADKKSATTDELKNKWHNALIYMLHMCGYIKIDSISMADLRLQSITLIDLFYKLFLDEVTTIVHHGLIRAYRHKSDNLPYLKGRLVFNRHLSENYLHKEKFYTISQVYDHNNIYNQILHKALLVLKNSVNKGNLFYSEICSFLFSFEKIDDINVSDKLFDSLVFTRNSNKYKSAIALARLILQNYSPDLKNGANNVIGILFDMNTLFEKVVYRILKKYEDKYTCSGSSLVLYAQKRKRFWKNKTIRPDILCEYKPSVNEPKRQFIIDTKWKIPQDGHPSDDDLKQMFAYNIHFGAKQSALLYPEMEGSREISSPYKESEAIKKEFKSHTCSTFFINLFDDDGYINKNAGDDLLSYFLSTTSKDQL